MNTDELGTLLGAAFNVFGTLVSPAPLTPAKAINDITALANLANLAMPLFEEKHHTSLDVAQDALDAVEAGEMSHEAALKIAAIALADHQQRTQKRIR